MKNPTVRTFVLLGAAILSACSESTETAKQAPEVIVPIEIVDRSPFIEIHVNGMPVRVQFDLGNAASNVSLFPAFLDRIEKARVGETGGSRSMYGVKDGTPIYRVDVVQIGEISFNDYDVVEDPHDAEFRANFIEATGAYGFVGPWLFQDHKLVVDYQREQLTIIRPDAPGEQQSICHGREIPLMPGASGVGALTLAKSEIGDIRLVWDTGAPGNIILKSRTDAADRELAEFDELILDQLSFGEHDFGPAGFFVRDFDIVPPFDGLIGYPFFRDYVVCFDISGKRLLIRE